MCQFCAKHGDGKKWYLQAENYAYDLTSDLKRRGFLVEFVRDFGEQMSGADDGLRKLQSLPEPARGGALKLISRRWQRKHFGQPVPLEECEKIFDITTSIVRIPCVCRNAAGTPDEAYCLAITTQPSGEVLGEAFADYELGPDTAAFQELTKEEALALLRHCEEQGMMHSVWTFGTPFIAGMCNCRLQDGCMAMRMTLQEGLKLMWKGEYVASADADLCIGCGQCAEVCPFDAIEVDAADKKATVALDLCYGCGTCRSACPVEALTLAPRGEVPEVATDW